MRRRTITTIVTVLLLAGGAVAAAQVAADRAQASSDRRRAAATAGERSHDLRDVATLQSLAGRFDAARTAKDAAALRVVRGEFRTLAMKERTESRAQIAQGAAESRPGAVEPEEPRREIAAASLAEPAPASAATRASRGEPSTKQANDQRDRDVAAARIQMRRQEIVMDLRNLGGGTNAATLDHERALMRELILLAKAESSPARPQPGRERVSDQEAPRKP